MFSYVKNNEMDKLTRIQKAHMIRQTLAAIAYMHEKNVTHRDIKLENIMMEDSKNKLSQIKIIDFGTATKF